MIEIQAMQNVLRPIERFSGQIQFALYSTIEKHTVMIYNYTHNVDLQTECVWTSNKCHHRPPENTIASA